MRVKYNPITNRFEKTDDETQKIEQTIKTENTKNRQGTVVKYNAMTNKFESVEPTVTLENKEEKESPTKISNQTILDMAEKNQENKRAEFEKQHQNYQNKLSSEYEKEGVSFEAPFQVRDKSQMIETNLNDEGERVINQTGFQTNLPNEQAVRKARQNSEEERQRAEIARYESNLADYILDQAKVENEDVNLWDKTLGNVTRAFKDLGSFTTLTDREYIDENGNKVYLPTYNELKQEKVSNSYDSAVGKFLGDSAYNISKIAGSSAINLVAPGVGTAAYWTDMFTDNYTSAINQGYDQKKALLYSTVGTGSEYLTGKLLGSATKGLTGGKSSQLSTLISNTTNKLLKNPKISTLIGNAGSEATEEFIQEYIGNINRLAVLENSTNAQDYFDIFTDEDILKDALYSAGVGALSGGLTNLRDSTGTNVQNNIDVLTEFKAQLQESKNNTTDSKKIETFDKAIKLVDDYLANPFVNEGNISSALNNVLQNTAQDITTNIQSKPERLNNSAISNQVNTFNLGRNNNVNSNTNNNNFIDSAKKYNIKTSDDTIRSIDRVMSERRINAIFDDTQFKNNNVNALWRINEDGSRAVVFNPNANTQDLMENVAVHELYHDIANQQGNNYLQDLVLNMASTKDGYLKARKALSNEYAKVYDASAPNFNNIVNEEAVASVLGEKLGNQEFINQLTTEKRSVARVIYDAVVSLLNKLNKLTGYKSEKLYWADVKNKFEKAYRSTSIEKNNNSLNSNTKFHISENLSKNIDNVLADINERNPVKLRDYTPDILVKIGIKDLPMYANPSHIRKNILTEEEAKKIGLSVSSKDHYHGLGKETYIEAIDSLDNPRVVFKNKNNKDYLILTIVKDKNNNNIIVPIEIETDTTVNRLSIDINRIKSVYGYNRVDPDLNQYIKYNIKNNSLTKIYEQKKQSTNITSQSTFSVNNISDSNQNVKSDTRYSMQQEKNNTQELDNSSFSFDKNNSVAWISGDEGQYAKVKKQSENELLSLEERVSGDNLLDAQDLINELESVGAKIDENGYVTVYHQTSEENAKKIQRTGKMLSKEQAVFFSTSREAQQSEGRGTVKLKFKIPVEKLHLDDIFNDNADVRIDLNGKKELDISSYITNDYIRYSEENGAWQEFVKKNFKSEGAGKRLQNLKENTIIMHNSRNNTSKTELNENIQDDVLTIKQKNNSANQNTNDNIKGDGESKFYKNITERSEFLTKENRDKLSTEDYIKYYDKVSNKDSMEKALNRLNEGGQAELTRWFAKGTDDKMFSNLRNSFDSTDVAEGWILLKRAQDNQDYDMMVEVAKKMREIGTKSGQAVQMYNVLSRLTPEGMVKYATSELDEAWQIASKNKSKKWWDKHIDDFQLKPEETQFIIDQMNKVEKMEDGYKKNVEIAKVQKMLQDKLPPQKGQGLKSWMRISMLLNPKTQVRNVAGNALIAPINAAADRVSAIADRMIAKKTGVRTTGKTNWKNYGKGFGKGLYQSYNDFKLGINTRNVQGNRFEIGQGKSFNENHKGFLSKQKNDISKALNRVDSFLSFVLDAGDRGFYEASFTNSINNQLALNNTTEVTQDMVDIATNEALSRTWQDNNNYTKFVLDVRRGMNKINIKGYGLGDVLIPFAKTPANLTKAIVDYSPVGLTKTLIVDGIKLKNNISNGTVTAQQQHHFVQNLGKATAGTMLYILGFALAQAGITTGANDDDKDVADFMKNTLGIQPYSIKIGNHSFTYDWAQPIAAPFAITADITRALKDDEVSLQDAITTSLDSGFNILLEQSFLSSVQDILNSSYGSTTENIIDEVLGLPARSVPTFVKQINDMIDPNTRMVYESNKPSESVKNQVKTKIPGLSSDLPVKRDTLGREIEKYGGENNFFNVFINPANISKGKVSESAKEIYEVYRATKDKTIMPRSAPNELSITVEDRKGNKKKKELVLDNQDKSDFLAISGGIVEENVKKLKDNRYYKRLDDDEKAEVIKEIVDYSYNKAKAELLDVDMSQISGYKTVEKKLKGGTALYDYYARQVYQDR